MNYYMPAWAYITQTTIILTNKNHSIYTMMYQPDRNPLPTIHDARQLQRLHDTFMLRASKHVYLMYDGYHYNPIRYGNETPHDKNFTSYANMGDQPTRAKRKEETHSNLTR